MRHVAVRDVGQALARHQVARLAVLGHAHEGKILDDVVRLVRRSAQLGVDVGRLHQLQQPEAAEGEEDADHDHRQEIPAVRGTLVDDDGSHCSKPQAKYGASAWS